MKNPGNINEVERAKEEGRDRMTDGDFSKAAKLLGISLRLNDNPDTKQLLGSARAAMARLRGPSSSSSSSSSATDNNHGNIIVPGLGYY